MSGMTEWLRISGDTAQEIAVRKKKVVVVFGRDCVGVFVIVVWVQHWRTYSARAAFPQAL